MNWRVPLSDIDLDETEIEAVTAVLRSRWLSMGQETQAFEAAFADYIGVRHALAVSNGTVALHLIYAAAGLKPGDEVIVPALTFVATANAITYTGATPVFADVISTDNLTIDPESIRQQITPQTRAIVVMHYGGYPCDMTTINRIAEEHNLLVFEDAAHAPGAVYQGQKCGTFGYAAAFSFFANKNLAMGEGGMITTNSDTLAEKIRLMRSHGMTTLTWDRHRGHAYSYDVIAPGYNYRLDEIHAALGLVQLSKLERNNQRRQHHIESYRQMLADEAEIHLPFATVAGTTGHLMPIILSERLDRQQLVASMKAEGIQTSMHYPPLHLFTYYREQFGTQPGILPVTEEIGRREVTLPLYPTMTEDEIGQVAAALKKAMCAQLG